MALEIYNTLTRTKEPFQPLESGVVRMYVCGPTVYDSAHIGHAMSYLIFDAVRRYLEHRGYAVRYVVNFTDIDDKILLKAQATGEPWHELAERYIVEFLEDMDALGVKRATVYPRATQEIPTILEVVQGLVEKGYAYEVDGSVYFRVTKVPDYGRLSGRRLEELEAGARVEVDARKEHPADFVLWKAAKPGEPSWESPWGPGRPGWHIECTAMNLHHLGPQIDIHGGGHDLIFPHHEDEMTQTEAFTGVRPFARFWMHNGLLQLGGEKMSKSLGNLITIREFLREHEADALRLFVLSSHYRGPLVYSEEAIEAAEKGVARLKRAFRPAHGDRTEGDAVDALLEASEQARTAFYAAMDDDFNTPQAVAALFDLVRAVNQARDAGVGGAPFLEAQTTLRELARILGFRLDVREQAEVAPFLDLIVEIRSQLRKERRFDLADTIRDRLAQLGVILEDTPKGTTWRFS